LADAVAIDVGEDHSCALIDDGSARCWGNNYYGQIGNGTFDDVDVPVPVINLSAGIGITGGGDHSCAVVGGGSVYCWGRGWFGTGSADDENVPVPVPLPSTVV